MGPKPEEGECLTFFTGVPILSRLDEAENITSPNLESPDKLSLALFGGTKSP